MPPSFRRVVWKRAISSPRPVMAHFVTLDGLGVGLIAMENPPGKRGIRWLLALLVQVLRHLEMMLQGGKSLASPILQFRIIAAFGVTLEQRRCVLVRTDLHRIIFAREILRFRISKLIELFLRTIIKELGGDVRFDWREQGLACEITLPIA